ncbi:MULTISPECIES: GxxExxY protein [unclassified Rudaea]|uniref:GxxExxY protein n=1 Tax=unclassified Rudaea TaxID=2627037 RepID=UPI0010F45241|nr:MULTISPECIES: GxxExxY protein [unclassified Rudaea]
MNTDKALVESDLTERVIGVFYSVYNELGVGFLENVYENALALALRNAGLDVEQQTALAVSFRGHTVGEFRADIVVEKRLILEIKAAERLTPAHEAQLINYLKVARIPVGLLLNFGPRAEFKRRIFD